MSNSLRDQLLGLGFKTPPKPEKKPEPKPEPRKAPRHAPKGKDSHRPGSRPAVRSHVSPKSREEMDLAKAYALRSETEKKERVEAERQKQELAKQKRELKQKVQELLKDKAQNVESAEHARHFEYNGKIRRVYATPEQLSDLNAGKLGVVQLDGRYLIVDPDIAQQVKALLPAVVALLVDPAAPEADDPYSDPAYQVPDDLVW